MKRLTVRLLESQILWLIKRADLHGSSISDCLRHILENNLENDMATELIGGGNISMIEKKVMTYVIFSYHLFESLVLNKGKEGEGLRDAAHRTSHEIVKKLHLDNNKNKINRVTFMLMDELVQGLKHKAQHQGMTFSKMIRQIIQQAMQKDTKLLQTNLVFAQNEGVKYAMMTYNLLEEFVLNYCEDGETIKNNAQLKTLDFLETLHHSP